MGTFEDQYLDVLQNIEFGIVQTYRRHPEMTDWDALNAVNALIRGYQAEARGQAAPAYKLETLAQQAFDAAKGMCDLRLGRGQLVDKDGQSVKIAMPPITLDEIIACLKRIRTSIEKWNRRGGRQGYLTFVQDFFPGTD